MHWLAFLVSQCGKETVEKKRYVKLTQMGVSSVQTLDLAIEELREAFKYALTTDVLEVRFMDMTEAEYEALPEFKGYRGQHTDLQQATIDNNGKERA